MKVTFVSVSVRYPLKWCILSNTSFFTTAGPLCSRCGDDYYFDGLEEVCVACDSKEAAKQSKGASKEILPIAAVVVAVLAIALTVAVHRPGAVQNWWNRQQARIVVSGEIV